MYIIFLKIHVKVFEDKDKVACTSKVESEINIKTPKLVARSTQMPKSTFLKRKLLPGSGIHIHVFFILIDCM